MAVVTVKLHKLASACIKYTPKVFSGLTINSRANEALTTRDSQTIVTR